MISAGTKVKFADEISGNLIIGTVIGFNHDINQYIVLVDIKKYPTCFKHTHKYAGYLTPLEN